jgi:hypothetical protein
MPFFTGENSKAALGTIKLPLAFRSPQAAGSIRAANCANSSLKL